jgi:hypothetical protein
VLKELTGINPFTIYAPSMTERLRPEHEHPLYREATARGLVSEPVVFVERADGRPLGSGSFDAYVFWPRTCIAQGRPDWMTSVMGRNAVNIPGELLSGSGLRLVQAFRAGDLATAAPIDQVVLDGVQDPPVLMLPVGEYWLRAIDRHGDGIGSVRLAVR